MELLQQPVADQGSVTDREQAATVASKFLISVDIEVADGEGRNELAQLVAGI